jgi:lipopolysaccharide export system permease protein
LNFLKKIALKKLDKLLVGSFLPPFVATFFIALFVLVMQTLWVYIDDIAGKGVGFFLLVELVAYMSVSMIPMALPIAVLISSVMVLGNMAEEYELSSIKSAGVSLWRVMNPLMFVVFGVSILSFFCSNNLIPISNLKFKSRLYDIRKQKPTLSMEEGMFNDDFQGYSIRIGKKLSDNKSIEDVLLYDHREEGKGRLMSVTAEKGMMYSTKDEQFFIMELFEGNQYNESKPTKKEGKENYPFVRTSFKEWTKVFDLNEFEMDRTDEGLFKSHHSMLSSRQLLVAVDSIDTKIDAKIESNSTNADKYFYFFNKIRIEKKKEEGKARNEERAKKKKEELKKYGVKPKEEGKDKAKEDKIKKDVKKSAKTSPKKTEKKKSPPKKASNKKPKNTPKKDNKSGQANKKRNDRKLIKQTISKPLNEYASMAQIFDNTRLTTLLDKAKTSARSIHSSTDSTLKSLKRIKENRVKHVFELHYKFSMAMACFIFLFVGAPMGAIVKKGGFGFPLLISIIFFVIFVILTIFSKNIAERFVIDAVLAAWIPCLVVFPIGLLLTWVAMTDASLPNVKTMFSTLKAKFEQVASSK